MRPDDRADRIKTLRDLWSEMMQNHTDIQRLWKNVGKGGLIWPTGIEAPPPIIPFIESSSSSSSSEESSSSSSSSYSSSSGTVTCDDCEIPLTLTMTISDSGTLYDGTYTLIYDSGEGRWLSSCINEFVFPVSNSRKMHFTCPGVDEDHKGGGVLLYSATDCGGSLLDYYYPNVFLSCDPFLWTAAFGAGTMEISE